MPENTLLVVALGGLVLVALLIIAGMVLTGRAYTTLAESLHGLVEMALTVAVRHAPPADPPGEKLPDGNFSQPPDPPLPPSQVEPPGTLPPAA